MAADLDATPLGRRLLGVAAELGVDLGPALEGGDDEWLRPTDRAQPTLVFTELVLAAALPPGLEVVAASGHSVGELAACAAVGALEPETAFRLSVERGRLMAGMREGVMAAILGLDSALLAELCAGAPGTVVVANLNAPGQVVVSGTSEAVAAVSARAQEAGARRVVPLRVGGAFHSPLMRPAADALDRLLATVPIRDATVPVVTNVDAAPVRAAEDIRDRLRRQMVSPVRWAESVLRMVEMGAEALVEVGPGSVLTGLARRIAPGVPALSVGTPEAASTLAERLRTARTG
jgi:[acyl-carrier-protein] S-malonyltransferase